MTRRHEWAWFIADIWPVILFFAAVFIVTVFLGAVILAVMGK